MKLKKFGPLVILLVLLLTFFALGGHHWISFEKLKLHNQELLNWVSHNLFVARLSYCALYVLLVAISFPGATLLTLLGGYLFGLAEGTLLVVFSATLGAMIIFAAIKFAFGAGLALKAQNWLVKMQQGFEDGAFSYLLILRLVPLFPFWVVNIVPALMNVSFKIYFITTVLGILPGVFVYVSVGRGLGHLIEQGGDWNRYIIFEPQILLPILGLSFLSLIPILYKKLKLRNQDKK